MRVTVLYAGVVETRRETSQDRFFLLTDTKLYYFDSSDLTSSTRKGSIVLKQVRVQCNL